MESVGIVRDPLTAGQAFMNCHQGTTETVRDYSADVRVIESPITYSTLSEFML